MATKMNKNSYHLLGAYYVPGTGLNTLQILASLIFIMTFWNKN